MAHHKNCPARGRSFKFSFKTALPALFLITGLVGCLTSALEPSQRLDAARVMAASADMKERVINAGDYSILVFDKRGLDSKQKTSRLHVYIEGDGHSWSNHATPSVDPTPLLPVALSLATQDPAPELVYLGRPCQFVMNLGYGANCNKSVWTNGRYAPQVIDSLNYAIDQLKLEHQSQEIALIGYSGGGALAVLIAARRNDVTQIITVAANLDTAKWVDSMGLDPLDQSLNPADGARITAGIKQIHFMGSEDKVIPKAVFDSYQLKIGAPQAKSIGITVDGYAHVCCWSEGWAKLLSSALPAN